MKKALGWTVKILSVRGEDGNEMRTILRESTDKTYVSFVAMDSSGAAIQATVVKERKGSDSDSQSLNTAIGLTVRRSSIDRIANFNTNPESGKDEVREKF